MECVRVCVCVCVCVCVAACVVSKVCMPSHLIKYHRNNTFNRFVHSFLAVLKSDNANGLFGFDSVQDLTIKESQNISIKVQRAKGSTGQVTVEWRVFKGYTGSVLATEDFLQASGTVVFKEAETEKVTYLSKWIL